MANNELIDEAKNSLEFQSAKVDWATARYVRQPPAFAAVAYVYALAVLLIGGVTYATFTTIPVSITVAGALTSQAPKFPVAMQVTGRIKELRIKDNAEVKKGDQLAVTDSELPEKVFAALKADVGALTGVLKAIEAGDCAAKCDAEFLRLSAAGFSQAMPLGIKDDVNAIKEMLNEYSLSREALRNVASAQAEQRRQLSVAEKQLASLQKSKVATGLATDIEQLTSKVGALRTEIRERRVSLASAEKQSRLRLKIRASGLIPRIEDFRKSQIIIAPVSGTVIDLAVSGEGQVMSAGQTLMHIIPSDSPLVAEVSVPNKDIATVKPAMAAIVRLEALPEREFGTLGGSIIDIPAAPTPTKGATGAAGSSAYTVRLKLERQTMKRGEHEAKLRYGMALSALIVTKRESLLMLGLKKILNIKDAILEG